MDLVCKYCNEPISPEMNFCSLCGKKIKDPPPPVTISAQIVAYAVSLLAPPFGLWYAYKYFKHGGEKEKQIAWTAVVLTIIATVVVAWSTKALIDVVNSELGGLLQI